VSRATATSASYEQTGQCQFVRGAMGHAMERVDVAWSAMFPWAYQRHGVVTYSSDGITLLLIRINLIFIYLRSTIFEQPASFNGFYELIVR
jgi:hypothetical protein